MKAKRKALPKRKAKSLLGNAKPKRRGASRGAKGEAGFGRERDQNDRGPARGYY